MPHPTSLPQKKKTSSSFKLPKKNRSQGVFFFQISHSPRVVLHHPTSPPLGPTWSTEEGELQGSESQRAMQLLPGPQCFQPRRRFETTAFRGRLGGFLSKITGEVEKNPTKIWGVKCRYADISINFGLKITNLQLPQINFDILMEVCLLKQPAKKSIM